MKKILFSYVQPVMISLILLFGAFAPAAWSKSLATSLTDLFYAALSTTVIAWTTETLAKDPLKAAEHSLGITSQWTMGLPFVTQVALVVFPIAFARYWMHDLLRSRVTSAMHACLRSTLVTPAMVSLLASPSAEAATPSAQVISVPGFADFLAVDGRSVWATNVGRVERWSGKGKQAEVAMSRPCGAMAVAFGSLWVADCKDRTLNRIDLQTSQISAIIATGIANPRGELNVVAGAGSIWVASDAKGAVVRVDPANNHVTASIEVDPGTYYLAFGLGSLWAVSSVRQSLQKIDPQTNMVVQRTGLGREPGFLVAGEGAVWVQEQGDGTVARIEPLSGAISGRVKIGETLKYGDIDAGGGKIWLRTTAVQTFVVIDPRTLVVKARIGEQSGSGALRYTPAGVWTTAHDLHTLSWWPEPENIGN